MKPVRCSFCGKTNREVRVMVAKSDDVAICDECVTLCISILIDHTLPWNVRKARASDNEVEA